MENGEERREKKEGSKQYWGAIPLKGSGIDKLTHRRKGSKQKDKEGIKAVARGLGVSQKGSNLKVSKQLQAVSGGGWTWRGHCKKGSKHFHKASESRGKIISFFLIKGCYKRWGYILFWKVCGRGGGCYFLQKWYAASRQEPDGMMPLK